MQPSTRTVRRVIKRIDEGYGSGRRDDYMPWLTVGRGNGAKKSFQHLAHLPVRRACVHLISKLEHQTALAACYLQPLELREALPLWPWDAPHPNSGWSDELDAKLDWVPGMWDLARDAGIEHGYHVGTRVPYVGTTDIVLHVPLEASRTQLVYYSCKPLAVYKKSQRARERVELDRIYARAAGARHVLATDADVDKMLNANLQWIRPRHSEVIACAHLAELDDFSTALQGAISELPLDQAIALASARTTRNAERSHLFFRLACWLGKVDIDLSQPIVMSHHAPLGGWKVRADLRKRMWGV